MRNSKERLSVLVADDDPVFTTMAEACLTPGGYAVTIARDGAEAIERLINGCFDLAIIDLTMPRIDGFRLIALINHTPELAQLPIMVVSSSTDHTAVNEAHSLGITNYIKKPVNWPSFAEKVRSVIAGAQSRHAG